MAQERASVIDQARSSVIVHTEDLIDNTNTLRGRKAKSFILPDGVRVSRVIFNSNYIDYIIRNVNETELNVNAFLQSIRSKVTSILKFEFNLKQGLKANLQILIRYVNIISVYLEFAYKTASASLTNDEELEEFIENLYQVLLADIENRQLQGSGWSLFAIQRLDLKISKHVYLPGRCSITIPPWIVAKHALLPIKNKDNFCFKWSILASYLHKRQITVSQRSLLKHEHLFNFSIRFPPAKKDITKFCNLNNSSVHIFGVLKKNFFPIYICKKIKDNHYNLLYLENGITAHYCPIMHLTRLIGSQVTKNTKIKYFCLRCFLYFPSQLRLDIHIKACGNEQLAKLVLPKQKSYYQFERQDCVQRNYIIATIDIESFLCKVQSCCPPPETSFTNDLHRHELAAVTVFCKVLSDTPEAKLIPAGKHSIIYKDDESIEDRLMSYLDSLARAAQVFFSKTHPIHFSKAEEKVYENSTECYACHLPFSESEGLTRVMDHCHLTPRNNLRGACHASCNLKMRLKKFIPIFAHGLGNYDAHFLIKMFAKRKLRMYIIPHTLEKYLCFSIRLHGVRLLFLDSCKFFPSKLQTILDSLPGEYFIETKKNFPEEAHELIFSKLPFCYTFLSGPESLKCTQIPPKSCFYNDLSECEVSDAEYERAKSLWVILKCKTFADFVLNYNLADCSQTLDVILYYRDIIFNSFGLELTSFLSMPQLSITAMLKLCKRKIQIFDESHTPALDMI